MVPVCLYRQLVLLAKHRLPQILIWPPQTLQGIPSPFLQARPLDVFSYHSHFALWRTLLEVFSQ